MLVRVLAVGDVVSEPGLRHLEKHLRSLQKCEGISFTVVNGERCLCGADAGAGLAHL